MRASVTRFGAVLALLGLLGVVAHADPQSPTKSPDSKSPDSKSPDPKSSDSKSPDSKPSDPKSPDQPAPQPQPRPTPPDNVAPNLYLPNGQSVNQYAGSSAVLGKPLAKVPPYIYGTDEARQAALGYSGAAAFNSRSGIGPYASLATTGAGGSGPYGSLQTAAPAAPPVYGGGYYGGYGYYDPLLYSATSPYYGYLKGVADVTTANAQYFKTIQEARLIRAQTYQAALELQRRIIEEADWERGEWLKRIDPETIRQHDQEVALDRALHDPPLTEILSARSLNDLLRYAAKQQAKGDRGPPIPLDQDLLKGINITGQDTRANIGLLKDDGKLQWPLSLEGSEFADIREKINKLLADAVNVAKFGNPVDPGKLKDLRAELGRLNAALLADINDLSPSQYIEAKRYLNLLDDAIRALEDPKVGNYFNQNWLAKGRTVAELVKYMTDKGLRFAPAVPGDADAYRSLYHALQAFDAGLTAVASSSNR